MSDQEHLAPAPAGVAIKSCWMCGIRLPASQMVADGGSACADVRWYCMDKPGCTERWTKRAARPPEFRRGTTGTPEARGRRLAG